MHLIFPIENERESTKKNDGKKTKNEFGLFFFAQVGDALKKCNWSNCIVTIRVRSPLPCSVCDLPFVFC